MRSTAATPMALEDVGVHSRVKVVVDRHGYALYFSRGPLPAHKGADVRPFPAPFQDKRYLLHLGLQCFDRTFLAAYCQMPATPLMVRRALASFHASVAPGRLLRRAQADCMSCARTSCLWCRAGWRRQPAAAGHSMCLAV